jgi:hypothetical protein
MILFSYSNEDTKDEERRKGWVVERRTKCGAKRQEHTLSQDHATTSLCSRRVFRITDDKRQCVTVMKSSELKLRRAGLASHSRTVRSPDPDATGCRPARTVHC